MAYDLHLPRVRPDQDRRRTAHETASKRRVGGLMADQRPFSRIRRHVDFDDVWTRAELAQSTDGTNALQHHQLSLVEDASKGFRRFHARAAQRVGRRALDNRNRKDAAA